MSRKGQVVANLQGFIMAVVTIAVVLAIGLYVLQSISHSIEISNNASYTVGSGTVTAAGNATSAVITQLGQAPTWIGLLIVVVFSSAI